MPPKVPAAMLDGTPPNVTMPRPCGAAHPFDAVAAPDEGGAPGTAGRTAAARAGVKLNGCGIPTVAANGTAAGAGTLARVKS